MTKPLPLEYENPAINRGLTGWGSTLGWAIYLGMSWTWCIGMFLPVLLIRDYRLWGWVVFAIPNVIGAAAMGWTVRSRAQSEELVCAHGGMAGLFSLVTASFQVFFALWIFPHFGPRWAASGWAVIFAGALGSIFILIFAGLGRWLAALALAISCGAIVGFYRSGQSLTPCVVWAGALNDHHHLYSVACLGIVCLLGFSTCPYLDLTFHRARQRSGTSGPVVFGLGFGVFFFAMILFTLAYADVMLAAYQGPSWPNWLAIRAIAVHLLAQLTLTAGLHWAEMERSLRKHALRTTAIVAASILVGVLAARCLERMPQTRIDPGEIIYRFFMSFYGLVFPAYVWICMVPNWHAPVPPSRRAWIIFGLAVLLASPFYFATFIGEDKMIWAMPGVAIVLLARAFVPWKLKAVVAYN